LTFFVAGRPPGAFFSSDIGRLYGVSSSEIKDITALSGGAEDDLVVVVDDVDTVARVVVVGDSTGGSDESVPTAISVGSNSKQTQPALSIMAIT